MSKLWGCGIRTDGGKQLCSQVNCHNLLIAHSVSSNNVTVFTIINIIFDQRQYNTINASGVEASGSEIDQMDQNWPRWTMIDLKPASSCEYWPLDSRPKVESYWKNFTLSSESDNYSMERSTDHGRCIYITAAELSPVMCDVSRSARCHGLSSRPPHGRDRGRCNVTL